LRGRTINKPARAARIQPFDPDFYCHATWGVISLIPVVVDTVLRVNINFASPWSLTAVPYGDG
jgi:hypothetical protein